MKKIATALLVFGFALCVSSKSQAQTSVSTDFCVQVQSSLAILAPNGPVALIHDGTIGIKTFQPQTFTVVNNDSDGATVTFATTTGFVHGTLPLLFRDVELSLAVGSADAGSNWTVDTATDQTDVFSVLTPDFSAEVQASSSAAGNAELDLTVAMDSGLLSTLVPGTYCTTVLATITAN